MKRSTLIGTIAAGALVLGGVGVGTAIAVNQDPAPEVTIAATPSETPAVEPTPTATSPVVAETPAATAPDDADAIFLAEVERQLLPTTQIADAAPEDLIAAGHVACEQLLAGAASDEMRLVEGEEPAPSGYYMDTAAIVMGARIAYCPETIY